MKKQENSKIKKLQGQGAGQENRVGVGTTTPVKENSQPKFNRKPEVHLPDSKKQYTVQIDSQIRYISPGRNCLSPNFTSSFYITDISFKNIAHKFAVSTKQLCPAIGANEGSTSLVCSATNSPIIQKSVVKIKRKTQLIKTEPKDPDTSADSLANKDNLNNIIAQNNRLSNELNVKTKQNEQLQREVDSLHKQLADLRNQLSSLQQLPKDRQELPKLFNTRSQQETILTQRSKQNSPLNRSHHKTRHKLKSNMLTQQLSKTMQNIQIYNINSSYPFLDSIKESCAPAENDHQTTECCRRSQNHTGMDKIKSLQEKVRYCEIEIDILRRAKMTADGHAKDVQKLRNTNQKLIKRLSFLRQASWRGRSVHSDSSLSLSLSPVHR